MRNKCKTCSHNCEGEYCFRHKPRKPLPMKKLLSKSVNKDEAIREISEMKKFFLQVWNKRPHYSEVSGDYLGSEPLTIYFHHILPKEKYPKAAFDEENIILLTFDEHTSVESDMYKYEKINEKRKYLLEKYA